MSNLNFFLKNLERNDNVIKREPNQKNELKLIVSFYVMSLDDKKTVDVLELTEEARQKFLAAATQILTDVDRVIDYNFVITGVHMAFDNIKLGVTAKSRKGISSIVELRSMFAMRAEHLAQNVLDDSGNRFIISGGKKYVFYLIRVEEL
jgi:hypothetical protein